MLITGSTIPLGLISNGSQITATSAKGGKSRAEDAAMQFEALMIGQMLRSAREAGGSGWMGDGEAGSALSEMAEQQFASVLASGGGIGLAKLVNSGLENRTPQPKGGPSPTTSGSK